MPPGMTARARSRSAASAARVRRWLMTSVMAWVLLQRASRVRAAASTPARVELVVGVQGGGRADAGRARPARRAAGTGCRSPASASASATAEPRPAGDVVLLDGQHRPGLAGRGLDLGGVQRADGVHVHDPGADPGGGQGAGRGQAGVHLGAGGDDREVAALAQPDGPADAEVRRAARRTPAGRGPGPAGCTSGRGGSARPAGWPAAGWRRPRRPPSRPAIERMMARSSSEWWLVP